MAGAVCPRCLSFTETLLVLLLPRDLGIILPFHAGAQPVPRGKLWPRLPSSFGTEMPLSHPPWVGVCVSGGVAACQAAPGWGCCLPPSSQLLGDPPTAAFPPCFTALPLALAFVSLICNRGPDNCPSRVGFRCGAKAAPQGRTTHPCFLRLGEPKVHHKFITSSCGWSQTVPSPPG